MFLLSSYQLLVNFRFSFYSRKTKFFILSLGFLGAYKNRLGLLQIFIGSLILILLLQLIAAIVGFTLRNKADETLRNKLFSSMTQYQKNDRDAIAEWDHLQEQWACCGVRNYTDWQIEAKRDNPPNSCCIDNICSKDKPAYFTPGCYEWVRNLFYRYSKALGGVSLFFFFVEIIGLISAIVLLRDLKNNYGSV